MKSHIDQAIDAWITTKFMRSESLETKKVYTWVIGEFRAWLQNLGLDLGPDMWSGEGSKAKKRAVALIALEAQRFAMHSKKGGTVSNSTYAQRLCVLASFYKFANQRDFFDCINPIAKLERPRLEPYGKSRTLNISDVVERMQAIDRQSQQGLRDYTLLAVYLQTGRRLTEVARLHWRDVRLSGGRLEDLECVEDIRLTLTFERCKGGKSAQHELSAWLSHELLRSVAMTYEINPLYLDVARPLWPSTRGRHAGSAIGPRGIGYIVKTRLGTTSVHRLRHTNAAVLYEIGLKLDEIQKLLGHEHLATTARYLPKIVGYKNSKIAEVDQAIFGVKVSK